MILIYEIATLGFSKRGAGIPQKISSGSYGERMLKVSAVAAVIAACADPASAFTVSLARWRGRKISFEGSIEEARRYDLVVAGVMKRKLAWTRLEDAGTDKKAIDRRWHRRCIALVWMPLRTRDGRGSLRISIPKASEFVAGFRPKQSRHTKWGSDMLARSAAAGLNLRHAPPPCRACIHPQGSTFLSQGWGIPPGTRLPVREKG
jgi:hypothetical protein